MKNTNNITGFKNARVDRASASSTTRCSTLTERIRAIREIDGILANDYQYVLHWYAPFTRVALLEQIRDSAGLSSRARATTTSALPDVVDRSGEGRRSCRKPCAIRP